ncbi:hypothetical protein E4658_12800 [Brucella suis]|nr:hypothetical protein E4658_12800 [Brucella suis]
MKGKSSSNDPGELESIRRDMLSTFENLPVAGEYMHRSAYDLSRRYGKDLFLFLQAFGTDKIPLAFNIKSRFDGITEKLRLGSAISDRLLQFVTGLLPDHLPTRLNSFRDGYEHHLLLKMGNEGIDEARRYLAERFPTTHGNYFECTDKEGKAAFLNRFAVGGSVSCGSCKDSGRYCSTRYRLAAQHTRLVRTSACRNRKENRCHHVLRALLLPRSASGISGQERGGLRGFEEGNSCPAGGTRSEISRRT